MKTRSIQLAVSALLAASLAVAVTACTTGTPSAGDASPSPTPTAAPSDRTYTSTDLADLLGAVKTDIASSGTVDTDTQVKAQLAKSGGAKALLETKGITFSPAVCRDKILEAIPSDPSKLPDGTPSVIAGLSDTGRYLTVASADNAPLSASLKSRYATNADDALSACSSIRLAYSAAGHSIAIELKLKKIALETTADQTVAIQETVAVSGHTEVVDSVVAIYGNLIISVSGVVSGGDASSLAALVDKTVVAAKALK